MCADKNRQFTNWQDCGKYLSVKAESPSLLSKIVEGFGGKHNMAGSLPRILLFPWWCPGFITCPVRDVFALASGARHPPAILGTRQTPWLHRRVNIHMVAMATWLSRLHLLWLHKIMFTAVPGDVRQYSLNDDRGEERPYKTIGDAEH